MHCCHAETTAAHQCRPVLQSTAATARGRSRRQRRRFACNRSPQKFARLRRDEFARLWSVRLECTQRCVDGCSFLMARHVILLIVPRRVVARRPAVRRPAARRPAARMADNGARPAARSLLSSTSVRCGNGFRASVAKKFRACGAQFSRLRRAETFCLHAWWAWVISEWVGRSSAKNTRFSSR